MFSKTKSIKTNIRKWPILAALTLSLLTSFWFTLPQKAEACVGLCCVHCGGNMPLNIMGGGIPEPKEFRFKVSQMFMNMGPLRNNTTNINTQSLLGNPITTPGTFAAAPVSMDMWMTMFGGAYSFTDDFALMAMFSLKSNKMPMMFNGALAGATGVPGFTMTSGGFGDTRVLGKYRLFADDNLAPTNQLSTVFGVSIPTGSINKKFTGNPVPGQNGTLLPYKMQLGSGTLDPVLGLTYQGSQDPYWYGANVTYIGRWYDNSQGYQQGDEFRLDLYGMYQWHEASVIHFQFNGFYEDHYSDEPDDQKIAGQGHLGGIPTNPFISPLNDPNNYGGTRVNFTTGVQWKYHHGADG